MKLRVREIALYAMLGALMYATKLVTDLLPNINVLGALAIAYTLVYRKKALYPIYIFVLLTGVFAGFATWWIPYLYLWAILWAAAMLLPRDAAAKENRLIYMVACAAFGLVFGTLYAPGQALLFGLDFRGAIAWIIAGLPWDLVHGVSNFFMGLLIVPVAKLLQKLERSLPKASPPENR